MEPIDQPLNGKILLITGGASGIGLGLTKEAYKIGAKVLVADLKTTSDFDTFAAGKDSILYVQSDVTHWPDFTKLFNACESKWGDVPDAYAICAGLFEPPFSNFWEDPEQDEGYKQVAVNVDHPIKLTRLALRKSLNKGKRASVCIISSVAGITGSLTTPLYSATKHAIVGFVKSMKDCEPLTGVKITAICPGSVATPIFDEQKMKQFSIPKEHFITPEHCATYMLDLLQKKEYACGTVLEVAIGGHRIIPEWNVSPPQGMGTSVEAMPEAFLENVMRPVMRVIESEKLGGKS